MHAHRCRYGPEKCPGSCACVCGAQLRKGPTFKDDSLWAWQLPDGSWAPFPDPNEEQGTVDACS